MAVGYTNHETFTRAFKRRFGMPPKHYQNSGRILSTGTMPAHSTYPSDFGGWQLSTTRRQLTRDFAICTNRYVGDYAEVPTTLWDELFHRCRMHGVEAGALVGIGWDNPAESPPHARRFDAGVVVPAGALPDLLILDARMWGVTTYVGSFEQLPRAYGEIGKRVRGLPDVRPAAGPVLEVYHTRTFDEGQPIQYLEVFVPLQSAHETVVVTPPS